MVNVLTSFDIHTFKKENSNFGVIYLLISLNALIIS